MAGIERVRGLHKTGTIPALTELTVLWGTDIKQGNYDASARMWVETGAQGRSCQEEGEYLVLPLHRETPVHSQVGAGYREGE